MQDIRIFTEGKADVKFLQDYIAEAFSVSLPENAFDPMGSWSGYKPGGRIRLQIQESMEKGAIINNDY